FIVFFFFFNISNFIFFFFFFSSRRRHTRYWRDWSSDVCSSDLSCATSRAPSIPTSAWRTAGRRRRGSSSSAWSTWDRGAPLSGSSDDPERAMIRIANQPARRRGFTMVELLLALGLLTILIVALLKLIDTSLSILDRTDENRELAEMSAAVMELLCEDVHALEGGARGDLLADWALFDVDRDGISGAPFQRLRLVRHVNAGALQRLAQTDAGAPADDATDS